MPVAEKSNDREKSICKFHGTGLFPLAKKSMPFLENSCFKESSLLFFTTDVEVFCCFDGLHP
jgi:hypothetical protein